MVDRAGPARTLGRDATFTQAVVGLGGRYDRVRADAAAWTARGRTSALHTAHVGSGDQVHDLRTMQGHVGRRTTSRLHSKAAVAGQRRLDLQRAHLDAARREEGRRTPGQHSLVLSDEALRRRGAEPRHLGERRAGARTPRRSGRSTPSSGGTSSHGASRPADAVQLILEGFFAEVEWLLDDAVLGAQPARGDLAARLRPRSTDEPVDGDVMTRVDVCESPRSTRRCRCAPRVGGIEVVVVRCGAEIYCLENVCSHEHFPLSDGEVDPLTVRDRVRPARRDVRPRDR